jgi:hypothetical protein
VFRRLLGRCQVVDAFGLETVGIVLGDVRVVDFR